MPNAPQIGLTSAQLLSLVVHVPTFVWIVVGVLVLVMGGTLLRTASLLRWGGLLAALGVGVVAFEGRVAKWQHAILTSSAPTSASPSAPGLSAPGVLQSLLPTSMNHTNPIVRQNPWLVTGALMVVVVWIGFYLVWRAMSPTQQARLRHAWSLRKASPTRRTTSKDGRSQYVLPGVELLVQKDNGRPMIVDHLDRFLNMLIVGSIGTGKTSRVLTKGAYQDLMSIASGIPMDVMVMDPDGGLVHSAVTLARTLGIEVLAIDLRGDGPMPSNISFNPFGGGDISDIVDNMRAVLREQMGEQEGFFQNAQDDLVRTVIQVQIPVWPESDFLLFAELVTEPLRFRAICGAAAGEPVEAELERLYRNDMKRVYDRVPHMTITDLEIAKLAARSFLADTRSQSKIEHLEKITKGLKIVVGELATNQTMRAVMGRSELPPFNWRSFFAATTERGRLVAVITGNRPIGKLFGRLFLVSMKMYALERSGSEDTRRPVYVWIDEFARFATVSLDDLFSQGRKYRVAVTLAIQTRAQLQLRANKKFVDVVEGSCRNKLYFPNPAPEDARYLQETLGSQVVTKETHSRNKLGFFLSDTRMSDQKVSVREDIAPRFRIEDLLYQLQTNEAVFIVSRENKVMVPIVGITSYADEWIRGKISKSKLKTAPQAVGKTVDKAPAPPVDALQTSVIVVPQARWTGELSAPVTTIDATAPAGSTHPKMTNPSDPTTSEAHDKTTRPTPRETAPASSPPVRGSMRRHDLRRAQTKRSQERNSLEQLQWELNQREQKPPVASVVVRTSLKPTTQAQPDLPLDVCPRCRTTMETNETGTKWICTACKFDRKIFKPKS
ncbi:MAG: type IV secretory system conjugative DNA transfer family protein [Bacilli bacterium]